MIGNTKYTYTIPQNVFFPCKVSSICMNGAIEAGDSYYRDGDLDSALYFYMMALKSHQILTSNDLCLPHSNAGCNCSTFRNITSQEQCAFYVKINFQIADCYIRLNKDEDAKIYKENIKRVKIALQISELLDDLVSTDVSPIDNSAYSYNKTPIYASTASFMSKSTATSLAEKLYYQSDSLNSTNTISFSLPATKCLSSSSFMSAASPLSSSSSSLSLSSLFTNRHDKNKAVGAESGENIKAALQRCIGYLYGVIPNENCSETLYNESQDDHTNIFNCNVNGTGSVSHANYYDTDSILNNNNNGLYKSIFSDNDFERLLQLIGSNCIINESERGSNNNLKNERKNCSSCCSLSKSTINRNDNLFMNTYDEIKNETHQRIGRRELSNILLNNNFKYNNDVNVSNSSVKYHDSVNTVEDKTYENIYNNNVYQNDSERNDIIKWILQLSSMMKEGRFNEKNTTLCNDIHRQNTIKCDSAVEKYTNELEGLLLNNEITEQSVMDTNKIRSKIIDDKSNQMYSNNENHMSNSLLKALENCTISSSVTNKNSLHALLSSFTPSSTNNIECNVNRNAEKYSISKNCTQYNESSSFSSLNIANAAAENKNVYSKLSVKMNSKNNKKNKNKKVDIDVEADNEDIDNISKRKNCNGVNITIRTDAEINMICKAWLNYAHPRGRVFWGDEVLETLAKIARGCDRDDDPVLGADTQCVIWHGEFSADMIPIIWQKKPSCNVLTECHVNRVLAFLYADNYSFQQLEKYEKKTFEMSCNNKSCINLTHILF